MLEWLFVGLIAVIFAVLNSFHVISQWFTNKTGDTFTGIAHYYGDYFLYVSQMAQGAAGHVFFYSHRFTNEPLPATWIWWFNGLLGWLGHLAGLSVFATYNLALIALVITLILLWHYVGRLIFPKSFIASLSFLIFVLTASSFFDLKSFTAMGAVKSLGYFWFSPTPAFNRLGGVPHQVWQSILFIALVIVFGRLLDLYLSPRIKSIKSPVFNPLFLLLVPLIFLVGTANPVQMLVFLTALAVTVFWVVISKRVNLSLTFIAGLASLASVAALAAWITNQAFNTQLFQTVKLWEANQIPELTLFDFLLSLGPIIFFIPFGLTQVSKKTPPLKLLFLSFTACSVLFFFSPLPKLLTTAPSRYLSPVTYAGLAILATDGFIKLLRQATRKKTTAILLVGIASAYLFFTLVAAYNQVASRASPELSPILTTSLNHVPKSIVDALTFLRAQPFAPRAVVLTQPGEELGVEVLIPVFANKITFTGHPLHTLFNDYKEGLVKEFFSGILNQAQTKTFLSNHRIGYILASTKNLPAFLSSLPFLTKIYQNDTVTIYKVNQSYQ